MGRTPTKEIVFYRSRIPITVYYLVIVLLICMAGYSLFEGKWVGSIILLFMAGGWHFSEKAYTGKALPEIKISAERLWTRNRGNKYWDSIICIKFRYVGQDHVFMDIYMSNEFIADEEFNLGEVAVSVWRLKRILKKYTRVEDH